MLGAEMLRRLTAPLRAAAPDDQLAEVTTEIAELARDMARLEAERSSLIVAKLAGDPEAEARVTAIDAEAGAIRRRLADLRQAEGRLRSEIASGAQLELDEAATAGRRRLAELHQRQAEAARAFDAATAEHVRTIRVMQANAEEAAGLSNAPQIKRWPSTLASQIRSAMTPSYVIDERQPPGANNNFLGLVSSWTGARAHWGLAQFFAELLDGEAAVFTSEAEAEACRERRAGWYPGIVVPLRDGLWTVVAVSQAFGSEAEAAGAVRSHSTLSGHAVAAWRGGWLALPAGLAQALAP